MNNRHELSESGQVHLRYSRAERLKRAPESVQRMYEPDYLKRQGLLKSLTATKGSRSMLFSIVVVCILILFSLFLRTDKKSGTINGIPIQLEALEHDSKVHVNVFLDETQQPDGFTMPVTVLVTATNTAEATQAVKTVNAVYIGSKLRISAQFQESVPVKIEAIIAAENTTLRLNTVLGRPRSSRMGFIRRSSKTSR